MIELIGAILFSSVIFVLFKLFPKYGIDTFQAIVFNYFTACICGFILYGQTWNSKAIENNDWMIWALISGVLFISLFVLMGKSSQLNGVALTSVSVKMSMAISAIFIGYGEEFGLLKISGISLAVLGVLLVSFDKSDSSKTKSIWMLLILFFGSGLLDFALNFVQKYHLSHLSASLFSAIGFGIAGLFGAVLLTQSIIRKQTSVSGKNIVAGIFLGIPNYFSIYLLISAYSTTGWSDSTVLAVVNVSIVIISALLGFIAFQESASKQKIVGLLSAISAIVLLYFANS